MLNSYVVLLNSYGDSLKGGGCLFKKHGGNTLESIQKYEGNLFGYSEIHRVLISTIQRDLKIYLNSSQYWFL